MKFTRKPIAFNDVDLEGTIQLHNDALMVTAQINGFVVERVMIDQGSGTNVMYPDLYRGFGMKKEDLSKYDTRVVILEGQILLPMNMKGKEVVVAFIVVTLFSPYTVILGKPWIHMMGAILSTLHLKVKFRTEQGIAIVKGSRQQIGKTNRVNTRNPLRRSPYSNYRKLEKE